MIACECKALVCALCDNFEMFLLSFQFLSGSNLMSFDGKVTLPRKPLSTQYGFDIVRHSSCRVMGPFKSHKRRHQFSFAGYFVTVAPRNHPIVVKLTSGKGVWVICYASLTRIIESLTVLGTFRHIVSDAALGSFMLLHLHSV